MFKNNDILKGFLGGFIGGAVVDLVFISLAGPSAFFSLLGITGRLAVFFSHLALGAVLGVLFVLISRKLSKFNIWFLGILWGLVCLGIIGGIPACLTNSITSTTTIFGFVVWLLFALILVSTIKLLDRK